VVAGGGRRGRRDWRLLGLGTLDPCVVVVTEQIYYLLVPSNSRHLFVHGVDLLLALHRVVLPVYFLLLSNIASPTRFRYHLIFPHSVVFIFALVCGRSALSTFTVVDPMGIFVL
jgi:hypothetical protein